MASRTDTADAAMGDGGDAYAGDDGGGDIVSVRRFTISPIRWFGEPGGFRIGVELYYGSFMPVIDALRSYVVVHIENYPGRSGKICQAFYSSSGANSSMPGVWVPTDYIDWTGWIVKKPWVTSMDAYTSWHGRFGGDPVLAYVSLILGSYFTPYYTLDNQVDTTTQERLDLYREFVGSASNERLDRASRVLLLSRDELRNANISVAERNRRMRALAGFSPSDARAIRRNCAYHFPGRFEELRRYEVAHTKDIEDYIHAHRNNAPVIGDGDFNAWVDKGRCRSSSWFVPRAHERSAARRPPANASRAPPPPRRGPRGHPLLRPPNTAVYYPHNKIGRGRRRRRKRKKNPGFLARCSASWDKSRATWREHVAAEARRMRTD